MFGHVPAGKNGARSRALLIFSSQLLSGFTVATAMVMLPSVARSSSSTPLDRKVSPMLLIYICLGAGVSAA